MTSHILKWFESDHLPPELREVVEPFQALATNVDTELGDGAEKATCLRKLLEAKDAAVRAKLES